MTTKDEEVMELTDSKSKKTSKEAPSVLLRSPKGSRRVVLRRINNSRLPDDLYTDAITKIGSEWAEGTKSIIRGLTPEEEEMYLPKIIGIKPNNPSWDRLVEEYWADFTIRVSGAGRELEIWTDDWGRPAEANLKDYIEYRFCLVSSRVAVTNLELENRSMYPFYIEDQKAVSKKAHEELQVQKEADFEFLKLYKKSKDGELDETKINWVMEMFKKGDQTLGNYMIMDPEDKEIYLSKKKSSDPELFVSIVTDPHLEMKSFIASCVSAGIIGKAGNAYLNGEEKIGDSVEETIYYLNDKKNSAVLISLKERLKTFNPVKIG